MSLYKGNHLDNMLNVCVFRCDQHEPGAPEADGTGAGIGGQ